MQLARVGLLCVAAAAASCSGSAVVSASVSLLDDEAEVVTEQELQPSEEVVDEAATLPLPHKREEEEADVPSEDAELDKNSLANRMSEVAGYVRNFAEKYGPGQRGGIRTAWVGAFGILLFLVLHSMAQISAGKPLREDVVFRHDSSITFTGAGLLMALTVFLGGVQDILQSRKSDSAESRLENAKIRMAVGRIWLLRSMGLIALGWVFGAPLFIMELATMVFFGAVAVSLLGLAVFFEEIRSRAEALKAMHKMMHSLEPMQQAAEVDPDFLARVLGQFVKVDNKPNSGELAAARAAGERAASERKEPGDEVPDLDALASSVDVDAMFGLVDRMLKPIEKIAASKQNETSMAAPEEPSVVEDIDRTAREQRAARSAAEVLNSFLRELGQLPKADAATLTDSSSTSDGLLEGPRTDATVIEEEEGEEEEYEEEDEPVDELTREVQ